MLEYELAIIHLGMTVPAFRRAVSQREWEWMKAWWGLRQEELSRAHSK